jgi:hypothetical protein
MHWAHGEQGKHALVLAKLVSFDVCNALDFMGSR